jgi:Na+/proline symporter
MSTISTQLNWGASYITNDLYKEKDSSVESTQKKLVLIGRIATISIMVIALIITSFIDTIDGAARFLIASSAGLGAVLILRWYWSRINVWSEISATIAPIIGYTISKFVLAPLFDSNTGNTFIENEGILLSTALFTTIVWILVTFLTKPEHDETLKRFYLQVEPQGAWNSIREKLAIPKTKSQIPVLLLCWISAVSLTYSTLFLIGKLIFQDYYYALINLGIAVVSFIILRYFMFHTKIFND